jgi:ABC-2 type transport system ATP-binding protein
VLVSSHLMSELQDTADHLIVVGRGRVIADTSVTDLISASSGDRVTLRTTVRADAMTVLERAGAMVTAAGPDEVTVGGLSAAKVVTVLGEAALPFSEVSAHRASLEEAYLDLTGDAVEFRAGSAGHRVSGIPPDVPRSPEQAPRAAGPAANGAPGQETAR